jgi:hypothetical protein
LGTVFLPPGQAGSIKSEGSSCQSVHNRPNYERIK